MPTVRSLLQAGTAQLTAAGLPSPRVDAELLLAHVLGITRGRLSLVSAEDGSEAATTRFQSLLDERAAGVPLQHLTGTAPFRHLELAVGPGVFTPRPETELILEVAGPALRGQPVVVDLCAGSGAIALAVAHETAARRVIAVERSADALRWLNRNAAARAAIGDTAIEVVEGDVSDETLLVDLDATADVVLSNPPYVPTRVAGELPSEVSHDPADAVFGGVDGLALMPDLVRLAARLLRPGGCLVVEHDESHSAELRDLLAQKEGAGLWFDITEHRDLTGRPRFLRAERTADRRPL